MKRNKNLKLPKISTINIFEILALGVLIGLGCFALAPAITKNVQAAPIVATAGVAITANAEATVAISVDDTVSIDLTPTSSSSGVFSSGVSRLKVATNNTSGYAIYLGTVSETSNLEPVMQGELGVIGPVSDDTVGNNFTSNTWGYNLSSADEPVDAGELSYDAVPASSRSVYVTDSANTENSDDYNLTFGVNIDNTLPAGSYTNSVLVSVVANPIVVSELAQLTYMQDMTSEICANTSEHATKQLVDTRDGNKYWVAKLRDGNCWMTQNLALDLDVDTALTPANSDVATDWAPSSSTNDREITGTGADWDGRIGEYSWNIGKIVLALPGHDVGLGNCRGIVPSSENLSALCYSVGYVDVSSGEWKATEKAGAGTFNGNNYGYVAVNETAKTYDAHYLLGNYYTYYAATAGTGAVNVAGTAASASICPKGWQLPTSGRNEQLDVLTGNGSFYYLLRSYGYPEVQDYQTSGESMVVSTDVLDGPDQNVVKAPMYFVRGGAVIQSPRTWNYNESGYYQSSMGGSGASDEYPFIINSTRVIISYNDQRRYTGNSVRCLAQ